MPLPGCWVMIENALNCENAWWNSPVPDLTPLQWAVGALCAFSVAVAKAGMPGLAMFVVPSMVLVVGDTRQSAGWLLPVLCIADLFAIGFWRSHTDPRRLMYLAPWTAAGIALGSFALTWREATLRPLVGSIVLAMLAIYLYRRMRPSTMPAQVAGVGFGFTAGFATTVANAAGPVMNLYLLSMRLPKEEFLSTSAWFFFVINLAKVPIYMWHGLFTKQSLMFNLAVTPAIVLGALTGRWVIQHIPVKLFEGIILTMTVIATLMMFR